MPTRVDGGGGGITAVNLGWFGEPPAGSCATWTLPGVASVVVHVALSVHFKYCNVVGTS